MTRKPASRQPRCRRALAFIVVLGGVAAPPIARADEGGVGFWLPGIFGSLTASPLVPGFAFSTIYYHTAVDAGGNVAFARQLTRGNLQVNFTGSLDARLNALVDLYMAAPSYTFEERFLGGQANVSMLVPYGRAKGSVDATLTGNLGLGGNGFTIGGSASDTVDGFGDLAPLFNLRWNHGVDN